jgi:hypothetical protein
MAGKATFSPDRVYRYSLRRAWHQIPGVSGPVSARQMTIIGLNPSTAGARANDQTLTRGIGFAQREGCGAVEFVNLFALISTDPRALLTHPAPVGPATDPLLIMACIAPVMPPLIVAAWGAWGAHPVLNRRTQHVLALLGQLGIRLHSFGQTKAGQPLHPSRLAADTRLRPAALALTGGPVIYCRGCGLAWLDGSQECRCTCSDGSQPDYEAWQVDPSPGEVPEGAWA